MRVLFLQGAAERAGAEMALLARLRHLPDHGIEPVVAFLADGPFVEEVRATGVDVLRLADAPPRARAVWRLPTAVRRVADAVRHVDADLVEGVGEKMALLAGWAARATGRPCVFSLHDAPRRDARSTAMQLAAVTGRPDAVVVPSCWMADAFRDTLGVHAQVIPNALVLEELPARAADVRAEADWPPDAPVAAIFGRLVAWKGHDVFVRAAARVTASVPQARFLIVGGTLYGWERDVADQLSRLAGDLGLGDRVRFAGHRHDALAVMAGCDVVCHCSLEPEPFGMVVIEAMALDRAVVATRTGGPEELVEDGHTGALVDPGDDAELARVVAALLADADRRRRLGAAAREHARDAYDSARVAETLAELYLGIAAGRLASA